MPSLPPREQKDEPTAKKKERKQRYLDSLMDRAGELSLRCKVILHSEIARASAENRLNIGSGRKLDCGGKSI